LAGASQALWLGTNLAPAAMASTSVFIVDEAAFDIGGNFSNHWSSDLVVITDCKIALDRDPNPYLC